MKKQLLIALLILSISSCKSKKNIPDVSDIKVDVKLDRFDQDFFKLDTNNVWPGLTQLNRKHPSITGIFLQNILGLDSATADAGVRNYFRLMQRIYDTVQIVFKNTDDIKQSFTKAFQFVKYYFPKYQTPNLVTIIGPVDAMAQTESGLTPDFLGPDFLGISLQFYLGKDYPLYSIPDFINEIAPTYRSRRFSKEYIIADGMNLIVDDLYPYKSGGNPLVEQMVEKGKRWYLLDKFLPSVPDSIKTGYTQDQLDWCNENEGLIWSYIVKNEDLNSLTPSVIKAYIGEAPFTQGFSQENSPGNLGQWLGWQIIKKFASKNPKLTLQQIMMTDPKKILDEAKYRPK